MKQERYASLTAIAIAALFAAVTTRYAGFAATISDASGYVSEASRWLAGDLFGTLPFAFWPNWPEAFTIPLGYRAGPIAGTDVFTYPPGLPLVMAAAMAAGGELAAYLVPPFMGGMLVWATGELAAVLAGARARVIAAALMATSAIALSMAVHPMSDVPAAAWWMLSLAFAARARPMAALASGLCVSMAILTRPNLAPLALLPAVLAVFSTPRAGRLRGSIFAGASAIGVGLLLWTQDLLYESPFASGHVGIGELFAIANVWENLRHYVQWYAEAHTPAVLLGALAPAIFWRARTDRSDAVAAVRLATVTLVAMIALVYLAYLFYLPSPDWAYLRFMLPALGSLYVLTAAVISRGIDTLRPVLRPPALIAVLLLTAGMQAGQAYGRHVTESWTLSQRVPIAGRYLDAVLPQNAIVITAYHSGSVRYYTGRHILRPDFIPAERLDATLARLELSGYRPYLLVDELLERQGLLAGFPNSRRLGKIDWPARATIGRYAQVTLYDLADPERYANGERWQTDIVR